jgi:hypothetical protein
MLRWEEFVRPGQRPDHEEEDRRPHDVVDRVGQQQVSED